MASSTSAIATGGGFSDCHDAFDPVLQAAGIRYGCINDISHGDGDGDGDNALVLILDELQADAGFLLHHFICDSAKAARGVCVIGIAQIFNHYALVARKLGVNLISLMQNGCMSYIDGLTTAAGTDAAAAIKASTRNIIEQVDVMASNIHSHESEERKSSDKLQQLYEHVRVTMEKLAMKSGTAGVCVILDDADALVALGHSPCDVANLISYLQRLALSYGGIAVILAHSGKAGGFDREEEEEEEDHDEYIEEAPSVGRLLRHHARVVLTTSGLPTGYSRSINGVLRLEWAERHNLLVQRWRRRDLHFKVLDSNVRLFAKGLHGEL